MKFILSSLRGLGSDNQHTPHPDDILRRREADRQATHSYYHTRQTKGHIIIPERHQIEQIPVTYREKGKVKETSIEICSLD
jgi:hypothetical protein